MYLYVHVHSTSVKGRVTRHALAGQQCSSPTVDAYGHHNDNEEEKETQTQEVLGASECVCVCVRACVCV